MEPQHYKTEFVDSHLAQKVMTTLKMSYGEKVNFLAHTCVVAMISNEDVF